MFPQVRGGLPITVASGLQSDVHEDAVDTPERVVKLLELQPRRAVNAQVHHHLLAPERPAFVEDGVREEPPPTSGVAIGRDELKVMAGIRLVRRGQAQAEVLLSLGEFIGFGRFR